MRTRIDLLMIAIAFSVVSGCNNTESVNSKTIETDTLSATVSANVVYDNYVLENGFRLVDTTQHPQDKVFAHGIDAKLPELKSANPSAAVLNIAIRSDFADLLNNGFHSAKTDTEHFRKISYRYFVADSLLSLVIEDLNTYHLSEATSEYKVYHYDLKNGKILSTKNLIELWGMSQVPLLNAVAEQCTMPPDHTDPLFETAWFETIKWKDINQLKLYKNNSQQIVVLYPLIENGIEAEQVIE